MQVPILSGVKASGQAEFSRAYPVNLEPVATDSGISKGQLRAPAGAAACSTGPGIDRGGIDWSGRHIRVMGTKLVRIEACGDALVLGEVGGSGQVTFDYSFDKLAIRSGTSLFYYDGASVTQVTDPDLGAVTDLIWIDGYFMITDGTYVVVTELSDAYQVLPTKYGSAEEDPDPITGLVKVKGEAYAIGRYTCQPFRNVGGNGFPFQVIRGGTIPYGAVSASAKCLFAESFAFVGSARGEALGVYVAGAGTAEKISTREIDDALAAEGDPGSIVLENRSSRNERRLVVRLAGETWTFLASATQKIGEGVWYRGSGRLINAVLVGQSWFVGDRDSASAGRLSYDVATEFDAEREWQLFGGLLYNEGRGGIVHSVELVGLPGRAPEGDASTAFLSLTCDGETFSMERRIDLGGPGERRRRLIWRPNARFTNYLGIRIRGVGKAMPGFARLEVEAEPLNV